MEEAQSQGRNKGEIGAGKAWPFGMVAAGNGVSGVDTRSVWQDRRIDLREGKRGKACLTIQVCPPSLGVSGVRSVQCAGGSLNM